MEHDGIESPPYPGRGTTALTLYRYLHQLRKWVIVQINQLRDETPEHEELNVEYPPDLPGEAVWEIISVADQFTALSYARFIRESWDVLLREYETDWDTKICRKQRLMLIQSSCAALEEAFVDPETREARHMESFNEIERRIEYFQNILRSINTAPEHRPNKGDQLG